MSHTTSVNYYRRKNAPPPSRLLQGSVVRIEVGRQPAQKTYFIHKSLLCEYSDYFKAALNSSFREGVSINGVQDVGMEEDMPRYFDRVYDWLYSGHVQTSAEMRDHNVQAKLVHLWILADRLFMPALQNATLDALDDNSLTTGRLCEISLVHVLWNSAPRSSKVHAWIVEQFAGAQNIDTLFNRDVPRSWNFPSQEFLTALTRRSSYLLSRGIMSTNDRLRQLNMCQFHEHRQGEDCARLRDRERHAH